jgi:hypothetical protein
VPDGAAVVWGWVGFGFALVADDEGELAFFWFVPGDAGVFAGVDFAGEGAGSAVGMALAGFSANVRLRLFLWLADKRGFEAFPTLFVVFPQTYRWPFTVNV